MMMKLIIIIMDNDMIIIIKDGYAFEKCSKIFVVLAEQHIHLLIIR